MMIHIKICGITNIKDAISAIEAGADMLGFNFHPPSPRSISPDVCASITAELKKFPIKLVGVFVNMPAPAIIKILQDCRLDIAQLHGDEKPQDLALIHGRSFKAFRGIPNHETLQSYLKYSNQIDPAFLLDAMATGLYGGSGEQTDWNAAGELAKQSNILLAGGLKPDNVIEAVKLVRPWGVDTASGVEIRPGVKDAFKMREFVLAARSVV